MRISASSRAVIIIVLAAKCAFGATITDEVRAVRDSLNAAYPTASGVERDQLAFQSGRWQAGGPVAFDGSRSSALYGWVRLKSHRYAEVKSWLDRATSSGDTLPDDARYLRYRFLTLQEDFPTLERLTSAQSDAPELIARGQLAFRQFRYDDAASNYAEAVKGNSDRIMMSEAILGYSHILDRKQEHQAALDTLRWALHHGGFSDDLVYEMANQLVPLGRVTEAIDLFNLTLEINPLQSDAHYFLGNGYATYNYTQLARLHPECFPDSLHSAPLAIAKRLFTEGRLESAAALLISTNRDHPQWLPTYAMLAEINWLNGSLDSTEALCLAALRICPDYGRAHAILARVYDVAERRLSCHYASDEAEFAATPEPVIPDATKFVVNWYSLTPRHRKRVALSMEPWKNFIPVLAATGNTYYIKPLHEKLSECPEMGTIADERVGLDSRLWDDVRGAGGFHTVTGIEDVERTIFRSYNTVLHELTHQVHGTLTDAEKHQIEATYRAAKAREAAGIKTFLTDYAASNEWEYFAEGVNSYYSPRRDEYDRRELVKERLVAMDSALVALVEHFTQVTDMRPYYAVGMANAADELLEWGKAAEAFRRLASLADSSADDLTALTTTSRVASILDKDNMAKKKAERGIKLYPDDPKGYLNLAGALWHTKRDRDAVAKALNDGLARKELKPRHDVLLAVARNHLDRGEYGAAIQYYDSALTYQADLPDALWGLGVAWGDSAIKNQELLDSSQVNFKRVLPERSGIVQLRLDYARIMMESGDLDGAATQISEAANLKPDEPEVWTYRGWLDLLKGDAKDGKQLIDSAAAASPAPDLARILSAILKGKKESKKLLKEMSDKVPYYRFNPRTHEYQSFGEFPAWQGRLLEKPGL